MTEIFLWWIGDEAADVRLLGPVRTAIEEVFDLPVRLWQRSERPDSAYDHRRQQYSSTRILKWLVENRPEAAHKVLGLTDVDLFIPILTFVFGEAQLNGAGALVSTARLRTGGAAGNGLLTTRVAKECVHELGHTFGLLHCLDPQCVMARSVAVLNVDQKRLSPCRACLARYRNTASRGRPNE
ncbi:MAG: archaemetzincin family Zn-dependent metalloprotease [Vicinamibacterales bacterium]